MSGSSSSRATASRTFRMRTGVSDRSRRGVRGVPEERHQSVCPAERKAAGRGLRRPHLQAHDHRLRSGHQGDARRRTSTASPSISGSTGRTTWSCLIAGDYRPCRRHWPWSGNTTADGQRVRPAPRSRRAAADRRTHRQRSPIPGKTLPILDIAYKGDAFDPGEPHVRGRHAPGRSGLRRDQRPVQEAVHPGTEGGVHSAQHSR